jgi:hypothetical protein
MNRRIQKIANIIRILLIRYRLRSKLIDLQALSAQQISDLYLGDTILGEIRTLQRQLDSCLVDGNSLSPRSADSTETIG